MSWRSASLQTRLIVQPLILQFLTIIAAASIFVLLFTSSGVDGMYADERLVQVAADAIVRDATGSPSVQITPKLVDLQKTAPGTWFEAKLEDGQHVSFGHVPMELASLIINLDKISSADLRGNSAPYSLSAIARVVKGPAGRMVILAHGEVRPLTWLILVASNLIAIPVFIALALVSVIGTPWIVRRALAGVLRTANQAEAINAERRGTRLSEHDVPAEIRPLVRAVNEALGRLDEGYERQHRFIASAAHELRTPIAILRMKIDASKELVVKTLSRDVSRLANLSEQLLDVHRLDTGAPKDRVDLAGLARHVAAELAPVLIASNKTIEVIVESPKCILGNAGSIERVLTNLIQNAIEHGGASLRVRVTRALIEVEDDGEGIPLSEHDRVFEPFHRLRPRSTGTGLGLSLVRQVLEHHGGRATISNVLDGVGTIVRVEFPEMA